MRYWGKVLEGGVVEDVVVVANAEGPERVEERARRDEHEQPEQH